MFFICINSAHARLANYEDIAIEYEFHNQNIVVNLDGSSERIVELQGLVLKDHARAVFAGLQLSYNGDSEQYIILEAKTINNGKEYIVNKDQIEDKPLASSPNGFDQQRQILLSFPNVEINSKIYLKYKYKLIKPPLDGVFANRIFYNDNYYKNWHIKLRSALPLHVKFNDPTKSFKIIKDSEDNFHSLEINSIKPIHHIIVEEPDSAVLNDKNRTWVSLSSLNSWKEIGIQYGEKYSKVIEQPLPATFELIKNLASQKNSDQEKINIVTSLINEKIQYMGDWRSIHGKLFPRDLKKIADSQLGDCKDFSVSTAAILNKLGYKAQVALIMRGITNLSLLEDLPGNNFNHAMLKVTNHSGVVYWVDPTNSVSMAQGIFPDIANKMVLILDPKEPNYEQVSNISPEHSQVITSEELQIKNKIAKFSGEIVFKGEDALNLTGKELYLSTNQIRNAIFYNLTGSYLEEDSNKILTMPNLTSRVVTDLNLKYQYEQKNKLLNTNFGPGISLSSSIINDIIDTTNNQVSDKLIGPPTTRKKRTIIKNMNIKQIENLNYEIDTPWVYFKRECNNKDFGAEIVNTMIIKTMFISNEDLKTSLYKKLKADLEQNVKDAILVLN